MAANTPRAGDLKDRLRFEQRAVDDNGDRSGDWGDKAATVWTEVVPLKGGEGVLEQRLQGTQPYLLNVRASNATRGITNAWRAVDSRDASRVFDISSATLSADRAWVQILAVQRVGQTNG